jgi:PAS domain S-box-containing protein
MDGSTGASTDAPRMIAEPGRARRFVRSAYLASAMGGGAVVVLVSIVDVLQNPPGVAWLAVLAMTCVSGWAVVRMPGVPVSVSPSDALTITAALLFGPSAGALCVACDATASSMRLSRPHRTLTTVLFNITAPALAMWVAAHLFIRMSGARPFESYAPTFASVVIPLAVFATVYFLLNTLLVAGAITVGRDASLPRVWREHFAPLWLTHFSGTSMAGLLLLSMTAGLFNVETLIVALPLGIIIVMAFSSGLERIRRRSVEFDELRSYAAALRSTADAVLLTDGDGNVTFMNAMAERLTGWPQGEARGRPEATVFRRYDPRRQDPQAEVQATDDVLGEYVLVRRDGSTCPIEETHAHIRAEDGTIEGMIRTFRDITVRKTLEAERQGLLRREQEARIAADTASRAKDEFLATLSHELRTPVMATAGWIRLLKEGRLDGPRAQRALASLDRTVRAQAAVLDDVLDVSRIVRGTLRLTLRRTDVGAVLKETVETVVPAVQAKSLHLSINVPEDLAEIDADPDRLRQVFWNLLSNAVKFTPPGGSISVTAGRRADAIRVEVADTGCGIPPEFRPFLFERFRQADSSDTRRFEGLGLGLAIVRHLVEAHGGTVSASSDGPGSGSRFVVELPATTKIAVSGAVTATAPSVVPHDRTNL